MAILITGGTGFVGLNLTELLRARGESVVLFGPIAPPPAFLSAVAGNDHRIHIARGSVLVPEDLDHAIGDFQVDRIIHTAAITGDLNREKTGTRQMVEVNTIGTIEVLEAALRHNVRRVVQVGTGSIFGGAGTLTPWLDEATSPTRPDSVYGISKFAAERLGVRYRTTRGLNLTVVRLGMVFGRWEYHSETRDLQSIPLQLLRAARAGGKTLVYDTLGDDWVHCTDVARGLIATLDKEQTPRPIYHLSAGRQWDIRAWCEGLKRHYPAFDYEMSSDKKICSIGHNNAPKRSPMNITPMRTDMGYEPFYGADNALEDLVSWAREHLPPD